MLAKAIEGILPGLREFRVPLVTGFLWAVFGWLLLADSVPDQSVATGFWTELFRLTAWLGRSGTFVAALSLVYLLGLVIVGVSKPVLDLVASASLRPRRWWRWR